MLKDLKRSLEDYNHLINSFDQSLNMSARHNQAESARTNNRRVNAIPNYNTSNNVLMEEDEFDYSDLTIKENMSLYDQTAKSVMKMMKNDPKISMTHNLLDLSFKDCGKVTPEELGKHL